MATSRTMKTLGALVVAMTVGSLTLILMETAPIRPPVTDLSAVAKATDELAQTVWRTDEPIKVAKWRHIVVHTSAETLDADFDCHFIVDQTPRPDGGRVRATALWSRQVSGNHVFATGYAWNADSIAVLMAGNFSKTPPSPEQVQALVGLVQSLQQSCGITAERVYLARDIDPRCGSPGAAFPAQQFNGSLLHPRRL
ncbi:MAG: N-acetylmuramoyl-L-alanine amidase [Phycisphaerae bacterium]|nr:N-acetylmuramoyl-L-alanine amidase [Phycisphaerae bacterium]